MNVIFKGLVIGLASLGMLFIGSWTSAQAASKTVKLPTSIKGTWYGYVGKRSVQGHKIYEIDRLTFKKDRLTRTMYETRKQSLHALRWQGSNVTAVHYTQKSKGVYRVKPRQLDGGTLMTIRMRRVNVKALGQKRQALKLADGDGVSYAFRQPLLSHVWNNDIL